jgi:hypothetical protein
MSKQIVEALGKILGDRTAPAEIDIENYQSRPAAVQTRGLLSPPPNPDVAGSIASPLTEQSRTEVEVIVPVPEGATTVSFYVASQIVMTDANGAEVIFNYEVSS